MGSVINFVKVSMKCSRVEQRNPNSPSSTRSPRFPALSRASTGTLLMKASRMEQHIPSHQDVLRTTWALSKYQRRYSPWLRHPLYSTLCLAFFPSCLRAPIIQEQYGQSKMGPKMQTGIECKLERQVNSLSMCSMALTFLKEVGKTMQGYSFLVSCFCSAIKEQGWMPCSIRTISFLISALTKQLSIMAFISREMETKHEQWWMLFSIPSRFSEQCSYWKVRFASVPAMMRKQGISKTDSWPLTAEQMTSAVLVRLMPITRLICICRMSSPIFITSPS